MNSHKNEQKQEEILSCSPNSFEGGSPQNIQVSKTQGPNLRIRRSSEERAYQDEEGDGVGDWARPGEMQRGSRNQIGAVLSRSVSNGDGRG